MRRTLCGWAALAVLLVGMPPGSAAATNSLRIGVPWPPGSKGMADLQTVGRDIAKKTAGRVQVKFVERRDLDSAEGACDGALLAGSPLIRRSPAAGICSLPLLFRTAEEAARLRAWLEPQVGAELEAGGWSMIAWLDLGFAYLHSRSPVGTVEPWKAARLWVPAGDPEALRTAEAYGVAPVSMEASGVRAALRAGTVDAVIAPPLGAILLQWHVEIQSVSDVPFLALCGAVAIRNEALARLDGPDQALLRGELARAFSSAADDLRQKETEALDVLVQNGVARHPLGTTPEQKAEWEDWASAAADRLAAGGLVPADALAAARQALSGFRAAP